MISFDVTIRKPASIFTVIQNDAAIGSILIREEDAELINMLEDTILAYNSKCSERDNPSPQTITGRVSGKGRGGAI